MHIKETRQVKRHNDGIITQNSAIERFICNYVKQIKKFVKMYSKIIGNLGDVKRSGSGQRYRYLATIVCKSVILKYIRVQFETH